MRRNNIYFIAILLLVNCRLSNNEGVKKKPVVNCMFSGQVRNKVNDEPMVANYRLSRPTKSGPILRDSTIYERKTDNNGRFQVDYDEFNVYQVEFYVEGFYVNGMALKSRFIKCSVDTVIYLRPFITEE